MGTDIADIAVTPLHSGLKPSSGPECALRLAHRAKNLHGIHLIAETGRARICEAQDQGLDRHEGSTCRDPEKAH